MVDQPVGGRTIDPTAAKLTDATSSDAAFGDTASGDTASGGTASGEGGSVVPDVPRLEVDAAGADEWERFPLASIERATEEWGGLFSLARPGRAPRVYAGTPAALRAVFVDGADRLEVRGSSLFRALVGEDSVGLVNGEPHRRMRRLLTPPLHGKALRERGSGIVSLVTELIDTISEEDVSARQLAEKIALRVMILTCFGRLEPVLSKGVESAFEKVVEGLRTAAEQANEHAADKNPIDGKGASVTDRKTKGDAGAAFGADMAMLNERIAELIRAAATEPNPGSVLGHLMALDDRLPDHQVRDQLVTLLLAGQESTPAAIVWALFWAHHRPEITERLRAELDDLSVDKIVAAPDQAPYLSAVCDETLRLSSVVPAGVTRSVVTDFTAAGHGIPAGHEAVPCIHAIHRDPALYPQPDHFDPDRFATRRYSSTEFVPYGAGIRRCLGAALASYEIMLAVATLVRRTDLIITARPPTSPIPQRPGPTVAAPDVVFLRRK